MLVQVDEVQESVPSTVFKLGGALTANAGYLDSTLTASNAEGSLDFAPQAPATLRHLVLSSQAQLYVDKIYHFEEC